MRHGNGDARSVGGHLQQPYAIPSEHFGETKAVNRTERIETKNGRNRSAVLNVRQATQRNVILLVFMARRYLLACFFYIPIAKVQAFARTFQLLAWFFHALVC